MRTNLWRDVPVCVGIVVLLAPLLWPIPACGCSKVTVGLSNVKRQARGLVEYANDHDDRYPDRDLWSNAIAPYLKTAARPDPDMPKGAYGYAFDAALSQTKQTRLKDPASTPLLYDSVNPIWNASDLCASLPLPGRHGPKDEGQPRRITVGYADGHAKAVPGVPAR